MENGDRDWYDALDEALMETFPASDPIAVSATAVLRAQPARQPAEVAAPS